MSVDRMKMYEKVADKRCQLCNKLVEPGEDFEYFKTKRKNEYLIHSECIIKSLTEDVQWKTEKQ